MGRDEVYRRALRAAAAVTGRAGRKLAGVSLGICMAGAGAACLPNSGGGGDEEGAGGTPGDVGGVINDLGAGGVVQGDGEASPTRDGAAALDAAAVVVDAAAVAVDAASMTLDLGRVDPDAAHADDMGPIVEDCVTRGDLSDWRCCAANHWAQGVAGCTPCDPAVDPSTWVECVTCTPSGQQPANEEEFAEFMACCESVMFEPGYGCTPWGPPAPPTFDGQTLAERLGETPVHV